MHNTNVLNSKYNIKIQLEEKVSTPYLSVNTKLNQLLLLLELKYLQMM